MSTQTHLELSESQVHQVKVDENQHVTLFLSYSSAKQFHNDVELTLANNAHLTVYHLQNNPEGVELENRFRITQAKNSQLTFSDIALGGAKARNFFDVKLSGEYAHCNIQGVFISAGEQILSTTVNMVHDAPNTSSHQSYKGIANDRSTGEFFTRVIVNEGAQNIDSQQSSNNLLLADTATIRSQPELEIYADDVKCAHGATVGALDEEALFYLRSRGVPKEIATAILTYAFVGENLDTIGDAEVRARVLQAVLPKIPHSHYLGLSV